ncbi:MAG: AbrB/MazE/SpoVT family DNA-binding domain-containing protein [Candidatus Dormibacteria bacterium]
MKGSYHAPMGERGRLVIPAELRARAGISQGTRLNLLETDGGLLLLTRARCKSWSGRIWRGWTWSRSC